MANFAYLFERFPSFGQTFCYREVAELAQQGITPPIFSIRDPKDEPPQDWERTSSNVSIIYLRRRNCWIMFAMFGKRENSRRISWLLSMNGAGARIFLGSIRLFTSG